ncbi:MAG TPA: protein kinase [Thermoanaerobaculia bacterium]
MTGPKEPAPLARGRAAADTDGPSSRAYTVERPRVPLVLKLFGLTALLIVAVVAVAVGITVNRSNRVANETIRASITGAAKLFEELGRQRLARLEIVTQVLGNDPSFVAYIESALMGVDPLSEESVTGENAPEEPGDEPAPAAIDFVSINDNLLQRREQLGSDLMILLNDQGIVVARTDQPMVASTTGDDFYDKTALVRKIVDDADEETTSGVLALDGKLFHAAVAPVATGARNIRIGYLINAYAIDDQFANGIAESTNSDVVFSARGTSTVVRSSNAPNVTMLEATEGQISTATLDRSRYILTTQPLMSGADVVGGAMFLRSLDRELAPFHEIERTMMIGGGLALLLAFGLSWLIAKRITRPIEQLAGLAQAVTAGDYSVSPDSERNDEVGILGRSFGKMIQSLRDQVELERLYAEMADKAGSTARPSETAKRGEGTILVTDLRGLPGTVAEGDAAPVIATLERAMRLQEREVSRQDGEVRQIDGHRLVAIFRGDRGVTHAVRAARAINEELASHMKSGTSMSIGAGIASGDFVTGSVAGSEEGSTLGGTAIIGDAPLLALLFAWHAPSGHAYVSADVAQSAEGELFRTAAREEVLLKWLPRPVPVASLPLVDMTTAAFRASTSTARTMRLDNSSPAVAAGARHELAKGQVFAGRYRIEQLLGSGGMGVVYRATDLQLNEVVAIKTLAGEVMTRSPEDLERFRREIRLARRITHRNVLRTFDYGEAEGVYFISMEFVRGFMLSEMLEKAPSGQITIRAAVGIGRQICRGLNAAHEQGIIHRDIKPHNILIDATGEVKLMDFGIARMTGATEGMTQAGMVVGTPHYMSPEQVRGSQLDARSDVYSMGILMYEMLAGRVPFASPALTGVLTAHLTEIPRPVIELRPDVGIELNSIVMRCLGKEATTRFADAGVLLADLEKVEIRK